MSAGASKPLRIVVYDATERSFPWLTIWWALGVWLLSRADVKIAARSWEEAYARIESGIRRKGKGGLRTVDLQVWGHGYQGAPLIARKRVDLARLARALSLALPASTVWFRACDVAEGPDGHEFMRNAVAALGLTVVAHCAVVSAPNPFRQDEICALRPPPADPDVWWSLSGSELPSCGTLRMSVPTFAYRTTRPP